MVLLVQYNDCGFVPFAVADHVIRLHVYVYYCLFVTH